MCLSVEICAHECRYWQRPEITELEMQLQMVESCLHALKHWAIFPTVGYSWQYFHSPGKPNCSIFLLKKKKSVNFILSCGIKAKLKKKKKSAGCVWSYISHYSNSTKMFLISCASACGFHALIQVLGISLFFIINSISCPSSISFPDNYTFIHKYDTQMIYHQLQG